MKNEEEIRAEIDRTDALIDTVKDPDREEIYRRMNNRIRVLVGVADRDDSNEGRFINKILKFILEMMNSTDYDYCDFLFIAFDAFLRSKGVTDEQLAKL